MSDFTIDNTPVDKTSSTSSEKGPVQEIPVEERSRQLAIEWMTASGEDFELEWVEQYGQQFKSFKNGPQTLRQLFAENRSDETFIVYENDRYTFEQAYLIAAKFAHILQADYGIAKGDRVAISMRNFPEWIFAFSAVTSIGAVAVAMNAMWTAEEMQYGLEDSGAKLLVADQERVDRFEQIKAEVQLPVIAARAYKVLSGGMVRFEDLIEQCDVTEMPDVQVDPTDRATILYTSGSTGHPKGAVSCHRSIVSALKSWELDARSGLWVKGLEPPTPANQPATLMAVPLFHATGSHAVYLGCYRSQRKLVCMYKWDVAEAARLIEDEKISSFVAPAAMTGDLVQEAKRNQRDLSTLQTVGGGGAPRAPEQVKNIRASFTNAQPNTGWGMTETNAIGTGVSGEDYLSHPGSAGRASAVVEIRIVDENGAALPANSRGELQVRGVSVIEGYWRRPDANAETFVDGWLRTGDVAYLDDDGFLYIVDRIKDLVIRGGENIGCAEVEAALLSHDAILEASVYAVPDERLGEEVGATLYVKEPIGVDELNEYLLDHIARFKLPRYVRFSSEPLPRIASGKIDKRLIRASAVAELTV